MANPEAIATVHQKYRSLSPIMDEEATSTLGGQ